MQKTQTENYGCKAPEKMGVQITAPQLLNKAETIMRHRAAQYDKPDGERSMAATILAFNSITGKTLSESDGWLILSILKMVRDNQRDAPHADSIEDLIAYAALYGESRMRGA